MKHAISWVIPIFAAACLFGACGGGGGSADLCIEVCNQQTANSCQPFGSLQQCTTLCEGYEGIGGDCLAKGEVYWQCQLDTGVCELGSCQVEGEAFSMACSNQ